jgi:pantothenate kinase
MAPERIDRATFLQRTADWLRTIAPGERRLLALAGPPGSGKSTLSAALLAHLEAAEPGAAALVPMDGFHFDDEVLVPRGWRPRKGAPHTFDVGGFRALLQRLRANAEDPIAVPRFDRDLEIARAGAVLVPRSVRLIVVEGNYLLLDEAPWTGLADLFDRTAFLPVDEAELARRLTARWDGYALPAAEVRAKVEANDLPNARLVLAKSRPADVEVAQ